MALRQGRRFAGSIKQLILSPPLLLARAIRCTAVSAEATPTGLHYLCGVITVRNQFGQTPDEKDSVQVYVMLAAEYPGFSIGRSSTI